MVSHCVSSCIICLLQYVGDIKSKMNLSPVVIGGSVTGFIVMMGLIFLALYFARRRGHGAEALQYTSSSQSSSAGNLVFSSKYYSHTH